MLFRVVLKQNQTDPTFATLETRRKLGQWLVGPLPGPGKTRIYTVARNDPISDCEARHVPDFLLLKWQIGSLHRHRLPLGLS